ncbi:MAG TPA: amidohydrolase [Xanthomonadales bacterium]|nr:amidohydrolase [Xanthomonadales bacterium]
MNRTACLLIASCFLVVLAGCGPREEANAPVEVAGATPFANIVVRDTAVYTLNAAQTWAQAVAIRDGRIVMVGSNEEAAAFTGPATRVFSQPGGMVLPGFQDAHTHPLSSGVDQFDCNLDIQPQERQAYLDKVAECARTMSDRSWISGGGWSVTAFPPNGIPHKAMLDAVVADRPVVFFSIDGHTAWANSKALEIAGIIAATPDPPNGRIDRDPETGEPVGSFQESAMDLIRAWLPPPPQSQIDDGMRYTIGYLHSLGITAMQEANASVDPQSPLQQLATYRRFADTGELKIHTVISLGWDSSKGLEQIHSLVRVREQYDGGLLNTRTVKFFLDGVVEPSTAALLQDYSDQPGYKGELQVAPEILNEAVAQLDALGFQVHIHVIGDGAVRAALDAFQFALERNGPSNGRHHLAHVEFVDPADLHRFAQLNVTATFSALWAVEDDYLTELTLPRVGPERYRWTYPINSVLQANGRIAFGSDWNVSSPDPLLAIETALTRIEPLAGLTPVFMPQERITLEQAVAAATLNAAYVNHLDDVSGSIEVGKLGDLVILDRNLFEIDPSAISDAKVVATLFGGEVVYERRE